MIDTPQTPTRDEARVAHNRAFMAMIRRVLRLARDENAAYYQDQVWATDDTGRALAAAIVVSDGEMMALADLLFDALHPEPAPALVDTREAEYLAQLAAQDERIAALRRELAATRGEAAKWRSDMERKLAQLGGRTVTGAGMATAHDHEGD